MKAKGEKEEETAAGRVLRELRETLKRARGAKGLLQDLEEDVRMFVRKWEERGMKAGREEEEEEVQVDSEDEEIVFVGRHGHYGDQAPSPSQSNAEDLEKDKLVFDSLVDDHGASFGYAPIFRRPSFTSRETNGCRLDVGLSIPSRLTTV